MTSKMYDKDYTAASGSAEAVTPDDGTDLPRGCRALYVGGTGTVVLILDKDSASVTLVGVVAGSVLPIRVKRVFATGTTATSIVALY